MKTQKVRVSVKAENSVGLGCLSYLFENMIFHMTVISGSTFPMTEVFRIGNEHSHNTSCFPSLMQTPILTPLKCNPAQYK